MSRGDTLGSMPAKAPTTDQVVGVRPAGHSDPKLPDIRRTIERVAADHRVLLYELERRLTDFGARLNQTKAAWEASNPKTIRSRQLAAEGARS